MIHFSYHFCFILIQHKKSVKLSGLDDIADQCDGVSFIELLTRMLKIDMADRITPGQILQHPFITMSHLETTGNSLQ